MKIQFLQNEEIDKTKWNSCVHYANNGNVFGYMWYLNNVAKEWDALIENDYESVLPLVWKPKILKTKEIYVPQLVRSLGIYSINALSKKRVKAFFDAIPKEYRNIELTLNNGIIPTDDLGFETSQKTNYQLLLNKDYESIDLDYSDEVQAVLAKANTFHLKSTSNLKPEKLADFYKKNTTDTKGVEEKFHALQRIMYNAMHRGIGFASGIENEKGELLAADFFIFSHGKMMSLIGTTSKEGEKVGAHFLLLDRIFQTNAQRPMILDFNDDKKWIEGLGAKGKTYFHVRRKKGVFGF